MKPSGKFVLRVPQDIHAKLRREAKMRGCSLNQLVLDKISGAADSEHARVVRIVVEEWNPLGVLVFGSTARGEARPDSDIDLFIVIPSGVRLDRALYRRWDELFPDRASPYSPQFVHLPSDLNAVGGIWLEAALEGHILYSNSEELLAVIRKLKLRIAGGDYIRKTSHGHPYWVRKEE